MKVPIEAVVGISLGLTLGYFYSEPFMNNVECTIVANKPPRCDPGYIPVPDDTKSAAANKSDQVAPKVNGAQPKPNPAPSKVPAFKPESWPDGTINQLLANAGFKGDSLLTMAAIYQAESGVNMLCRNYNLSTGDDSYGGGQINMLGRLGPARRATYGLRTNNALFDPITNVNVAYRMSGHGTKFTDWSTFKRGEDVKFRGKNPHYFSRSGCGT